MQFIVITSTFLLCALVGVNTLKCHRDNLPEKGAFDTVNESERLIDRYMSDRPIGACFINSNGTQDYDRRILRGSSTDVVCVIDGNNVRWCYCATDGCNAQMPDPETSLAPVVNCVGATGRHYTCGASGSYRRSGNKCGTLTVVIQDPHEIILFDTCVESLADTGCFTAFKKWDDYMAIETFCVASKSAFIFKDIDS